MKLIKIKKFRVDEYGGEVKDEHYKTLEEWQKENPKIKIIDTKVNSTERTYIENFLLVTYEIEEEVKNENS